ncbi:MAG: hypothetical protein R3264_11570 [Anaerolineae bacterium]|nr:hypothetical protein [Anaerolineae bacterium]
MIGDHIRWLRDNPARREQLAENALNHARSRSWRATMDQLAGYYQVAYRQYHQMQRQPG